MYSQKNEEEWVLRHAGPVGRFLDIGSYDGVQFSNTMALVERGWEGIMVEPSLQAFKALLDNHGQNEKLHLVHAAVTPAETGLVKFWPQATTFSTTEPANVDRFIHEGFGAPYLTGAIAIQDLVKFIVREWGPVDVVSIDTEGSSVDILVRLPMDLIRPRVIVVEHDGRRGEVEAWAARHDYQPVVWNEENVCLIPR